MYKDAAPSFLQIHVIPKKNLTKSNAEKRKLFEFFISQGTYVHCTRPSEGNKAKINNKPSKKRGLKWIFYINIPL